MNDGKKALAPLELGAWDALLNSISAGVPLDEACLRHLVTRSDIDAITRSDALQDRKWREARLAGERCGWSALDFDEILERIGAGTSATDAIVQVRGRDDSAAFFRLVEGIPGLTERYTSAQRQWALREANKLIDIADDESKDTLPGPKGGEIPNMAKVQRDRLRIETRRELMGDWHPRMFGAQKNQVQVNVQVNHAAVLEEARARARDHRATPSGAVLDATFSEVKPAAKAKTADTPVEAEPVSTLWLEEGATAPAEKPTAGLTCDSAVAATAQTMDTSWLEDPAVDDAPEEKDAEDKDAAEKSAAWYE